ncbi:MAG: hypothetical protein JW811_05465 [Clostridiales bacterium]|nr:hypothetical protein [Clostridiales bacterium]
MNALNQIASALGSSGDWPNIDLAQRLSDAGDRDGIAEIAGGLRSDKATASDCIKVLYETGYRDPALIAGYADVFLNLLRSKNNRLVWGAMIALGCIAGLNPKPVYAKLDTVLAAYETGSVITRDSAVSVLAALCGADAAYEKRVMPVLVRHFRACRAKEIPQHFERVSVCLREDNHKPITDSIRSRLKELSASQQARVIKAMKKLGI